jgi:hypothetical protein
MKRVPWAALGVLLAALGARLVAMLQPALNLLPECAFKRMTGFACVTCGLTRCVAAMGRWRWAEAFHWHPVATVLACLLPPLALWDLRRAWRNEPYPELPESPWARVSVWLVLLSAWALQVMRGI